MVKSYKDLARVPHLPRLFLWSMVSRLNVPMLPIGLTLLLVGWSGSYAAAGVLGGALTVGQALVGPIRGRAADGGAARKLLVLTGVGYAVGIAAIVLLTHVLPGHLWPLAVLIAVPTGMSTVPISQVSRATWPKVVERDLTRMLYMFEATGSEVISTMGPLLTSLLVAALGAGYAVIACGVVALAGALAFADALGRAGIRGGSAQSRADAGEASSTSAGSGTATEAASAPQPDARRSLFALPKFTLAILATLAMMGAIFSVNLSVVAWTRNNHESGLAGVLIASWTIGSALGGISLAALHKDPPRSLRFAAMAAGMAVLALLLPPVATSMPVWSVAIVLFLGGTAIAPSMAANFAQVSGAVPHERRAEAFGWLATAATGGAALSMPLTGVLLDASGPAASVAVGAFLALCAMVLSLVGPRRTEAAPAEDRSEPQPSGDRAEPQPAENPAEPGLGSPPEPGTAEPRHSELFEGGSPR